MPIRDKIRPIVRDIVAELVDGGYETYIVGGAVRDLLMDIEPKDYDIATGATPEEVRRLFGRRRCRIIGRRFKLAHVYGHGEIYEVSTFRRQPTSEERSQRVSDDGVMIWRDNEYGNLAQDAERRDFTVNALYYDPVGDRGIIDMVGGVRDLEERRARAIGDPVVRLEEDPVRALRGLKLVGQFGFTLESSLGEAVAECGSKIALASQNRLFEELLKILSSHKALSILETFHKHDFLQYFWPRLAVLWDGPVGEQTRAMIAERDRRVSDDAYSGSKALALATVALPSAVADLGEGSLEELWEHRGGIEHHCRDAIQSLFEPLPVSRFFTARVRDILLLMPRFHDRTRKTKVLRHPEYKYGRELYSILLKVCGWDEALLEEWPVIDHPSPTKRSRGRGGRGRGGRRNKPSRRGSS